MSERRRVFDALYRTDEDPWSVRTSRYERDKYAATLAALPRERYASALEIGCSIGVMSTALAARCDTLLAIDVSAEALCHARRNCTAPNVRFDQLEVPLDWPSGRYDLIVFSEVLYFLHGDEVDACAELSAGSLASSGGIVTVNWRGETDTPLTGDEAAARFVSAARRAGLRVRQVEQHASYVIHVLASAPPG